MHLATIEYPPVKLNMKFTLYRIVNFDNCFEKPPYNKNKPAKAGLHHTYSLFTITYYLIYALGCALLYTSLMRFFISFVYT